MGDINEAVHNSTEALHLNRYSVTPVNNKWVITEQTGLDSFQYWTKRDTQQDAIDEVLHLLNVDPRVEWRITVYESDPDIDAWNQPEAAMDLLERIMAAIDRGSVFWCCEPTAGSPSTHHVNCLLDEARKLCGPGD